MKTNQLDSTFLKKCVLVLEKAFELYNQTPKNVIEKDIYRSACIKEFEIILEQSANMIRKILKNYVVSHIEIDRLYFKDIFRKASQYSIISVQETERWLEYRDNRNKTAHEYGLSFAQDIIEILNEFIDDAKNILKSIEKYNNNAN